ncbi:B-cell receptor CD22-like isoform X2 [Centruroides sculpturatus]|uniref:B-cell receptor CD22-like isoform X2 n=1 Tax=Centruroides sculpturatus TaxID=218467 RepID=UPI000C6D16F9|nr:B-cell receptor CD22-like isoform X2 [Centruroides sculpturatus]
MCQSKGSRPPAQITWMKGNVKIDSSQEITSEDGDTTTSTLTFVPSSEDNRKSLLCRAENPDLPESALNDEWTMNVLYVPQLSLTLGASDQHEQIREGSNVYFECNIQANPSIYEIGWKYEGQTLAHDPPSGINVRNNSLSLQGVRRSHRGRYQCVARNAEGEGESEEVLLRVQFAPVCSSGQKVVYGAARHEDVRVTCEVDADPPSVEFHWGFNNTDESLVIVSYTTSGTKSVAKYVPRNKQDYGYLYCWGKNEVGMQLEPCIFSIVPIGELQPVAINAVLAVLMGTVGALLLLVIVIIFIMKARGSSENRGASSNIDNEEKIPSPIKKEFDDGSPDVIPSKNYSTGKR